MDYCFEEIVVAGTFDRLHQGHQRLLFKALNMGKKVWCGLATSSLSQQKILPQIIQSYQKRKAILLDFLRWQRVKNKSFIFPLNDPFGPAIDFENLQAIVATMENRSNVEKINHYRRQKNLKPLYPIYVDLLKADDQQRMSSSRIRLGEINRQGRVFSQIFKSEKIILPQNQRHHFKKPLGELWLIDFNQLNQLFKLISFELRKPTPLIISVGDIVTSAFLKLKLNLSLALIDYQTQRQLLNKRFHKDLHQKFSHQEEVENQAGTLNLNLIQKLHKLFLKIIFENKNQVLKIKGEEDLTVLPIVLLAPLESLIFYGQPNYGVVKIRVTEEKKEEVYRLLQKFI